MPQLDSLRAFAIGIVMIHHFLPTERIIPPDYVTLGFVGVRLFFVLSGFLITGILLRARGDAHAMRRFYRRRVLRIFPIYYLTLAVVFVLSAAVRSQGLWLVTYTSNFVFPFRFLGPAQHFWTLAVEEQFYFIWPCLMLLVPNRHLLKIITGAICMAILFRFIATALAQPLAGGVWPFGCLDSLGLGGLLAFYDYDSKLRVHRERFLFWSWVTGSLILIVLTILYIMKVGQLVIAAFLCLGASLIFVVLIARAADGMQGKIKIVLEFAPVIYIGRISYGLYVYHNFMPAVTGSFYSATGIRGRLIFAAIATALTFATAIVSWHLIEKPISRLNSLPLFTTLKSTPTESLAYRSSAAIKD